MASLGYIAGGLLGGVGEGMVQQGRAKREAALEAIKMMRREQEAERDRQFKSGEAEKSRKFEAGQAEEERKGRMSRLDREYELKTGLEKTKADLDKVSGTMSPADKRIWDIVVERHTTESMEGEAVDWNAVAGELRQRGRDDLATLAVPEGGGSAGLDVDSPEWREATRQAEAEASDKAGWLSTDASDFPETSGNRSAWINQRAREIYQEMTGGGSTQSRAPESPTSGEMTTKPLGKGTRENPYKATTQAQVNWFRQNAKPGDVLKANGRLYTKE